MDKDHATPGEISAPALSEAGSGPATDRSADLARMRACPHCDALYELPRLGPGQVARCARCHATLVAPRGGAMVRILALAMTALILMAGAIFWPFLDLSTHGLHSESSVLDAIAAFADGPMLPLSFATGALIVVIPSLRLALLVYVLAPLVAGKPALPRAGEAFRHAMAMRPWSMAEIFLIGVAVALVKVAGLASVHPGPAFWALCGLVLVTVLQDSLLDQETIWQAIEEGQPDEAKAAQRAAEPVTEPVTEPRG